MTPVAGSVKQIANGRALYESRRLTELTRKESHQVFRNFEELILVQALNLRGNEPAIFAATATLDATRVLTLALLTGSLAYFHRYYGPTDRRIHSSP